MNAEQRRDLLEILEDRHGARSTLATSQLPAEKWHDSIGDPTLADAILDRLVHNAYKINLKGESMRKQKNNIDDDVPNRVIMTNTHVITRLGVAALLRSGWQLSCETGGRIQ